LAVVSLLDLNEFVMAGVLLIAACPTGSIANLYVYLARANVALAVALTGISCLLAFVSMPLVMLAFAHLVPIFAKFQMPVVALWQSLFFFLLLPVALGMFLRHRWPELVHRHHRKLGLITLTLMIALDILIVWQTLPTIMLDLAQAVQASLFMAVFATLAGAMTARLLRLAHDDLWTVTIRMMVQNMALAATIAVTVFQQYRFASFAVTYFLAQLPVVAILVLLCLGKARRGRAAVSLT